MTLESLIKDSELKTIIKDLVRWSGRSIPPDDSNLSASSISGAVSDKQQLASAVEKIRLPSESNVVPQKGALAVS